MTGQDENLRPVGYDEPVHQPFDVQAQRGQYAMWKLLGAIAFLIILALLVFFVYQPGARDRDDPVIISPNKTALKVPPLDSPKNTVNDKAIYQAGKSGSNRKYKRKRRNMERTEPILCKWPHCAHMKKLKRHGIKSRGHSHSCAASPMILNASTLTRKVFTTAYA